MVQGKRARPAFSPPRPGKSKSVANEAVVPAATKASTKRITQGSKVSKRPMSATEKPRRSRYTSPTPSASGSDRIDLESGSEVEDEVEDAEEDVNNGNGDTRMNSEPEDEASEPDMILAEVTRTTNPLTSTTSESDASIPVPLLHRIMHEAFADKDRTKLAKDARVLVSKYVEVFVREAIMRSAFERGERDEHLTHGVAEKGWLEVEDLERCAGQLVLDF